MASFGGDEREEKIQVSVRVRPLNAKEISTNDFAEWECINSTTIVFKNVMGERTMYPNAYMYDRVFEPNSSTREVYDEAAKEVALSVVNGINSSIFAYGQTSSGKTYTMAGITQYTIEDIFDYIEKHTEREFVLKFYALEIYNEAVRDLLIEDTTPIRLLDDPERGTVVERLTGETLRDKSHLLELVAVCEAQRQTGETSLNETSSRSHQILRLTVESSGRQLAGANSSTLSAIVNFVDLAGSERSSQSIGTRLKEGCHINRSLLTLGTVIRKLSKGGNGHVPYRDSKLTRILQHSLGGNARTAIICTMSPAHSHTEQSRNTLVFATCAKEVDTNARVNVVMSDKAMVQQLRKELAKLEGELQNMSLVPFQGDASAQLREKELQIEEMEKELKELSYQHDVAQSRIEELLLSNGQQGALSTGMENRTKNPWLDDSSMESDYQHQEVELKGSQSLNDLNTDNPDLYLMDDFKGELLFDDTSPQFPDEPPEFSLPSEAYEKIIQATNGDVEDNYKEVQCIEVEKVTMEKVSETQSMKNSLDDDVGSKEKSSTEETLVVLEKAELEPTHSVAEYSALMKKINDLQETIGNLTKWNTSYNSPYIMDLGTPSVHEHRLLRSRSCRAIIASSSQRYDNSRHEQENHKDFPGPCTLNSSCSVNSPTINRTSTKEFKTSNDDHEHKESKETLKYSISNDQKSDEQSSPDWLQEEMRQNQRLEKSSKDELILDIEQGSSISPSIRVEDFEVQQKALIKLWDSCHISLVHRSYFFLLFTGSEPSDSMYVEVELRRLSFIQSKFCQGEKITIDGQILTPSSSMRALSHEREMLSRQMNKKLTTKERETLFKKWGIRLDTKRRRLQLANLLWKNLNDMDHLRESVSLVAKLCGFNDGGQVPKEMFVGSNFALKSLSKRSFSWRDSFTSLV